MRRRKFVVTLGTAIGWSLAAMAQTADRVRWIGILSNLADNDPEGQARFRAFLNALRERGWIESLNVRLHVRWGSGDNELIDHYASELVALKPDLILATGASTVGPLRQKTVSIPIVFVNVVDPVGAGFVDSLARPGGNATGFTQFEQNIGAKWLELLIEAAPAINHVAVLQDPEVASGKVQLTGIDAVAPSLGIAVEPVDIRDIGEAERAIARLARKSQLGLIVLSGAAALHHRRTIVAFAARHRVPGIYPNRVFVEDGGLMSYAPDPIDAFQRAAGYADRILSGEKPGDLPVQATTRLDLTLNRSVANSIIGSISNTLLARADEVIE